MVPILESNGLLQMQVVRQQTKELELIILILSQTVQMPLIILDQSKQETGVQLQHGKVQRMQLPGSIRI